MKSITIHGVDEPLSELIKSKAQSEGLSINKTIKKILESSLGVKPNPRGSKPERILRNSAELGLTPIWLNSSKIPNSFVKSTRETGGEKNCPGYQRSYQISLRPAPMGRWYRCI